MSLRNDLNKMAGKKNVEPVSYQVYPKENFYFMIAMIISSLFYAFLAYKIYDLINIGLEIMIYPIIGYILIIIFWLFLIFGILIGNLRGNGIRITANQFPEIYEIAHRQSLALGLSSIPEMYLLQAGGALNAFATKFLGRNYVVLYSDVMEEAYLNNKESVEFIIAHELGHVKRNHISKTLFIFPSFFVPFLYHAYSRACEYTCDRIGAAVSPGGAETGLLLIAAGKQLYRKVNTELFVNQNKSRGGFWIWMSEKISTHPHLTKRLKVFSFVESSSSTPSSSPEPGFYQDKSSPVQESSIVEEKEKKEDKKDNNDHSRFMPS